MRNPLTPLGGTEMEVLRVVWARGRATARDVHDEVVARRRVAYTTIMTVLKNLADKGYLRYEQEGAAYVYTAARAPEEVRGSLLASVLEKVFGGSPRDLVQALARQEALTDADRAAVEALLTRLGDAPEAPFDADA